MNVLGQITYGGLDNDNCSPDIVYVPLSAKTYFEFKIDAVEINGRKQQKGFTAISDSGTSLIYHHKHIIYKIEISRYQFDYCTRQNRKRYYC